MGSYTPFMPQPDDEQLPRVITDVEVTPGAAPAMLPALRADLVPLLPAVRRAATVIAAAAVADWALRTGTRALWREGLSAIGRRPGAGGRGPAPVRSETLIVERVILHRSM